MKRWRIMIVAASTFMVLLTPSFADSWRLPETKSYTSEDKGFRFTVIPRGLSGRLEYFEDKVREREPAGQDPEGPPTCRGILETKSKTGSDYLVLWKRELSNEVSPVWALVSNGGFVVTFDNWHSIGYGSNVVVIYNESGEIIRQLALSDFLSKDHIEKLPHSVSSIRWGGHHYIEDSTLVLRVISPESADPVRDRQFQEFRINLADGATIAPDRAQ